MDKKFDSISNSINRNRLFQRGLRGIPPLNPPSAPSASALEAPPHCLNTWKAEHQRKMSFPFSEKIGRAQNQKSKEHFSLVLPSGARQWRGFHHSRIFDKVGSSEVVKALQDCRNWFLTDEFGQTVRQLIQI